MVSSQFVIFVSNRPFAQLLPGLETGHPVTVGQSPTCSFSVSDGREVLFLSPFRAVLGAIHVQVIDRPSPDAPSLTQTNNCANGLFQVAFRLLFSSVSQVLLWFRTSSLRVPQCSNSNHWFHGKRQDSAENNLCYFRSRVHPLRNTKAPLVSVSFS